MPLQTVALDPVEIQEELARRGYGFHGNRNVAIHLTRKKTGERFRITGQPKIQLLAPISFQHYQAIVHKSATLEEACDQFEAISTGKQLGPSFGGEGKALDPAVLEKIVESRMENMMAAATEPMAQRMADQQAKLDDQAALIEKLEGQLAEQVEDEEEAPPPPKRKKTAKKAKKPGRKKSRIVAEAEAELSEEDEDFDPGQLTEAQRKANANSDEPVLSKDQQAMLGQIQMERPE